MKFSDSHCHIDFANFDDIRPNLLEQCANEHIHKIIVPGVEATSWQSLLKTVSNEPHVNCQLFPALGIHPWYIKNCSLDDLSLLDDLLSSTPGIVALGEIGLDGKIEDMTAQIEFFERQLDLASKHNLPVIVHHRKSHQLLQPILKSRKLDRAGVIHGFSGSFQQAKAYLDLGFKLGIGSTITYERAKKTINTVKKLPIESLLLETDAPSMPIQGEQGQDNSPLKLIKIFDTLCKIRSESPDVLAKKIEENLEDLFF